MKNTKTKKLVFHNDPGHGWLEVKRQDLEDLKIQEKISSYSYQDAGKVYLEEDCDAAIYTNAAKAAGIKLSITNKYTDEDSFIRNLAAYNAAISPEQVAAGIKYINGVRDAVAEDPDIIAMVQDIEKGIKTTQFNYGRYMAILTPHADKKLFCMGLALGLIKAGANYEGVSWARRIVLNQE